MIGVAWHKQNQSPAVGDFLDIIKEDVNNCKPYHSVERKTALRNRLTHIFALDRSGERFFADTDKQLIGPTANLTIFDIRLLRSRTQIDPGVVRLAAKSAGKFSRNFHN